MKKMILTAALLVAATALQASHNFGCLSGIMTRVEHGKIQCLYMWAVKHSHIKPWWVMGIDESDPLKQYYVCDLKGGGGVVTKFDYDSINTEWCDCPK